jgi:hypothetical protein
MKFTTSFIAFAMVCGASFAAPNNLQQAVQNARAGLNSAPTGITSTTPQNTTQNQNETPQQSTEQDLLNAISNTINTCSGMPIYLDDLRTKAGLGAVIGAAGTVAGGIGVASGLMQKSADERTAQYEETLTLKDENGEPIRNKKGDTQEDFETQNKLLIEDGYSVSPGKTPATGTLQYNFGKLEATSNANSNIRTGANAIGAAVNITGTVLAATNYTSEEFRQKIDVCLLSVETLRQTQTTMAQNGAVISVSTMQRASKIVQSCSTIEIADLDAIDGKATGAAVANAIGIAASLGGAVVGGIANTDENRMDAATGTGNATTLNTMNDVATGLSGGAAAASLGGTIFSSLQLSAINDLSTKISNCDKSLN